VSLLDDISTRGDQIRARLRDLLSRREYPSNTKTLELVAYVDIALEHHEAIWLLRRSKLTGSAFALVRSGLDAYLRALWINKVATPEQIEKAARDELRFPRMDQMHNDIKASYGDRSDPEQTQLLDKFFEYIKQAWQATSSYTHSGGLQLGRRFTAGQVKPNYTAGEIVEALSLATLALLLLLHMFLCEDGPLRGSRGNTNAAAPIPHGLRPATSDSSMRAPLYLTRVNHSSITPRITHQRTAQLQEVSGRKRTAILRNRSRPFVLQICSLLAVHSLSVAPQQALQFAFAAARWSLLVLQSWILFERLSLPVPASSCAL
jgi:hypothetical protein